MPALRVFDTDVVVGILAYVQTLPSEDERLASIGRGGRLYDKWYAEIGVDAPEQSHPSYPVEMSFAARPEVNWRCKECHGWDSGESTRLTKTADISPDSRASTPWRVPPR